MSKSKSKHAAPVVYALGSNGAGQLGIGHNEDVNQPEKCIFRLYGGDLSDAVEAGNQNAGARGRCEVQKIVAGGNHTLLLTTDGRLFVAGKASGIGEADSRTVFEEQTHILGHALGESGDRSGRITNVAATWEASFVVLDNKIVCGWGAGGKGELGLGPDVHRVSEIKKVFEADSNDGVEAEIVAIAACVAHVVVLLSDGRVFGWGRCRKGQFGEEFKKEKVLWSPTRIDRRVDVVGGLPFTPESVALGREYTVLVRAGEKPLVWGERKFFREEDLERTVKIGETVVSGWSSIHTLSSPLPPKSVRSMGKNDHGQLAPANIPKLRALAAGSEHCIALTTDNQILAWGWGEHGNCGEDLDQRRTVVERWSVISLPRLEILTDVAAGCATSFLICGENG